MELWLLINYFLSKSFILLNHVLLLMEINRALRIRISDVKESLEVNKNLAEEKFLELWLLSNRVDKEHLDRDIFNEINDLREKIVIDNFKSRLRKSEKTERKLTKIDDFDELCELMKTQKFDEAIRKFYEKDK